MFFWMNWIRRIGIAVYLIYGAAALIPVVFLMRYIYKQDRLEPEPQWLLRSLLMGGVISAFPAIVLEQLVSMVLDLTVNPHSIAYPILQAFLVAAAVEEGVKLFFLKRRSWQEPNFNYWFDGVVYAVAVSLGFAGFENILYVFRGGLQVALMRAVLSVPAHMCFGVVMGLRYSRARFWAVQGRMDRAKMALCSCYVLPMLLHGAFDACLMIGTNVTMVLFWVLVVLMYVWVWHNVRTNAAMDRPFTE